MTMHTPIPADTTSGSDVLKLLDDIERAGVRIGLEAGSLVVDVPIEGADEDLIDRIQAAEQAIIRHLMPAGAHNGGALAPASFAQQRLWFIDRLEGGSPQYHQPIALRLKGRVDIEGLRIAFQTIVDRHEALRTVFELEGRRVQQRVQQAVDIPLPVTDLRQLAPPAREAEIARIIATESAAPFDLSSDPMVRARLLLLEEEENRRSCVLTATLHHIASDGWSVGRFLEEFVAIYTAHVTGTPNKLPALTWQYADFARWHCQQVELGAFEDQASYWQKQLAGIPTVHALPLDRPRPARQNAEAHCVTRRIGNPLRAALARFARSHGVTTFLVLQCTFAVLLYRRSGETDIVMGIPFAGRSRPETEALIGFFAETLVFRNRLDPASGFDRLLAHGRETAIAAFENSDLPFDQLVDLLKPERSQGHSPIYQVLFSMNAESRTRIALPDLEVEPLDSGFRKVKCDLELEAEEGAEALTLTWRAAASLFELDTVERMAAGFELLLHAIIEAPERPLRELEILPEEEAGRILSWNRTDLDLPSDGSLLSPFEAWAREAPNRIAILIGERSWTYGEVDALANGLARLLIDRHGVTTGTFVGHCVDRSLEMIVAILAIMKAGGAYVALDPGLPQDRLSYMAEDSCAAVVLTQPHLANRLEGTGAHLILLEDGLFKDMDCSPISRRAGPDDPAYVIYTSGSTGRPKGTLNLHRGPRNRIEAMQHQFQLTPDDRVLQKTPLSFDVSVWEIFWPLGQGATLVLARPDGHKDPIYIEQVIVDQGITVVHFVPSMLQIFLRTVETVQFRGLRYLMVSGEALTRELQRRCIDAFPNARMINHYGPTETAIEVTWWGFNELRADGTVPIGRPIANTRIHILDETNRPVPIGVKGHLHIAGVQVGEGYLNNPEMTSERFVTLAIAGRMERVYRTGDLARWLPDGEIEYLGRNDGQIKLRGMRVELGEIETRARSHPQVDEAVAIVDGLLATQQLICYVVAIPGVRLDPGLFPAELRRYLAQYLPSYVHDCRIVVLDRLPVSPNGKIDRFALPKPGVTEAPADTRTPPATDLEQTLLDIWSTNLGVAPGAIGTLDNFFEIGGNSLMSVAVQADIRKATGQDVAITDIFEHPTIQSLARHLSGHVRQTEDRADILKAGKSRLLLARSKSARSR